MSTCWVGVDVSKRKLEVAVLDERGRFKTRVFGNDATAHTQLLHWLGEHGVQLGHAQVCLEATGPYSEALATALAVAAGR